MFAILNRFRGTKAYWAKIVGVVLGLIFGFLTGSWILGVATAVAYVLGESFGWGKWIGGILSGNTGPATPEQLEDIEGEKYGIHQIAEFFVKQTEQYQKYCTIALGVRGFYWWAITFLPLVVMGFISIPVFLLASIALGVSFPLSVYIGMWASEKWGTIEIGYFSLHGGWSWAEMWYGLAQDIVIWTLFLLILL